MKLAKNLGCVTLTYKHSQKIFPKEWIELAMFIRKISTFHHGDVNVKTIIVDMN